MYFKDLSTVSEKPSQELITVGWLDSQHPFSKGVSDEAFLDALFRACLTPLNPTRGFHRCEFCRPSRNEAVIAERGGEKIYLGNAEIRIPHGDGRFFAAPNLIFHYVEQHSYLPPLEFVRSVRQQQRQL